VAFYQRSVAGSRPSIRRANVSVRLPGGSYGFARPAERKRGARRRDNGQAEHTERHSSKSFRSCDRDRAFLPRCTRSGLLNDLAVNRCKNSWLRRTSQRCRGAESRHVWRS
jgi:hypothetical protein